MDTEGTVRGSCLCGGLVFHIVLPVKFCCHCHCESCRRAHGAPVVTWAGVTSERFAVVDGTERLVRYESSPDTFRGFCRTCGTTLFFESSRWAGEVHVAVANLERLPGVSPAGKHAFYEEHVGWLQVADPPGPSD